MALNGARAKGHDAVIMTEVHDLTNLMELEYESSGSYGALQGATSANGWWWFSGHSDGGPCSGSGGYPNGDNYVTQAIQLCTAIYNNSADDPSVGSTYAGYRMLWGINSPYSYNKYYSIMVYLPGAKKWYCVGTDGTSQINWGDWGAGLGCWGNP